MKNVTIYILIITAVAGMASCTKAVDALDGGYGNYPGGTISPYIAIFDVRSLYKGADVTLTEENMLGSSKISAMVVSDHTEKNLPEGLLVVQDSRRLSRLRGISIALGAEAANYMPGDSVEIDIRGGTLTRVDGILEITGITNDKIDVISSDNPIAVNLVRSNQIIANPDDFESVFSVIVKGGFVPLPTEGEILVGDKSLNDGFGNITLHTESAASFANNPLYGLANYYGISFNKQVTADSLAPEFRVRKADDIVLLSSTITVTPVVIAGFMSDVKGGDGNYEYIQLLATRDIDFAATPFSVVVCNNAGTASATQGWATGTVGSVYRTYKFNLTTGFAQKGTYFYVGGAAKRINGANSTSIASLNWIRAINYTNTTGDGFGPTTSGLFANLGNASGLAVFEDTVVTLASEPVDVIMVDAGGAVLDRVSSPPNWGYRLTNTDWYDLINPITLDSQPFFDMGSNKISLAYNPADVGYYNILGGVYNTTLGRWTTARTQINMILEKTSPVDTIQGSLATKLEELE